MEPTRDLGVSLSGGGHRATVFGLGVLLALVDQRLNQRIVSISSVSGGSIANGIVMVGPDIGTTDRAEFERHLSPALQALAERGVLLGGAPATRGYIRAFAAVACMTLVSIVVALVSIAARWWLVFLVAVALACLAGYMTLRLFHLRSSRTERAIDAELLGGRMRTLAELRAAAGSVHHVICTTELQTGTSFYFTNRAVYGYGFGGAAAGIDLALATAVQASACVPGAFLPRTIDLARLQVATTGRIVVSDGGVYDNMADEWEYGYQGRRRSWPELATVQSSPAEFVLIANASGGWNDLKPIAGNGLRLELAGLLRAKDVQYDVSTAHRRRALAALFRSTGRDGVEGAFAQITASPFDVTEQFGPKPGWTPDERSARAVAAREFLLASGYTENEWEALARETSGVATTLAPLGGTITAKLLEHGYVLTMINLFVIHGLGELVPIDRARFTRLCMPATR